MFKKPLLFVIMILFASSLFAFPKKLTSYDAIKRELLTGNAVKAIVDFGKCQIIYGDTGKEMRQTIGFMIENFMISNRTQALLTSHEFINSLDKTTPYGRVGYRLGDIAVMPNNEVIIDTAVLRLPDYTLAGQLRFSCKMSEGANFYTGIYQSTM